VAKKKSKKSKGGHDDFLQKLAVAALAAVAGSVATETVKALNAKPPAPPTVVIIERDRQTVFSVAGSPVTYAKEKPGADPPQQGGAYTLTDKDQQIIDYSSFSISANAYSDLFLKAAGPLSDPSNAVTLNVNKGQGEAYSFLVDRENLRSIYAQQLGKVTEVDEKKRQELLEQIHHITLDLTSK
jgi:hypothetical protein